MAEPSTAPNSLRTAAALIRRHVAAVPDQPPTRAGVQGVWLGSRYHLTWPPAVATHLADWLDRVADDVEADNYEPAEHESATAVAGAYLRAFPPGGRHRDA